MQKCMERLSREWEVSVIHIYREQNNAADALAKSATNNDRLVRIFETSSDFIKGILERDWLGSESGRLLINSLEFALDLPLLFYQKKKAYYL